MRDKFLLGYDEYQRAIYIKDFSWDCGWYWSGGYISLRDEHSHFSQFHKNYKTGRDCNLFDGFNSRIVKPVLTATQVWRLCDLMRQFYAHKESAECFQYGGHYISEGRNEDELNKVLADKINAHIKNIIIPEFYKLMKEVKKNK